MVQMMMRAFRKTSVPGSSALLTIAALVPFGLPNVPLDAQSAAARAKAPESQTAANRKMAFDVASVRPSKDDAPFKQNVALDALDAFPPTGGFFTANSRLSSYIIFAYKMSDTSQYQSLTAQLPKWAQTDRFDIEARAEGNPTKDQMRLMMQSLLADRFKLALHTETRQLPVYALVTNKAGKLGPQLKAHPDDVSCPATPLPHPSGPAHAPFCGALLMWPVNGQWHARTMNLTMEQIAHHLGTPIGTGWGGLDHRPVVDQTELSGKFDFDIEFTPESNNPPHPPPDAQPEPFGPTFLEALKDQLGLKLVKQTGPVQVYVIDHVERPTEN
jgi:uncharacterized protein (TIGR03435 family)